ncbi:MAG: PRC-barrel domain-containing protein [Alphaproteobacteria bacterium]|nr:PRC-barrel domain-containing protein [Alphaproteobacteria bacterium]
MSKKSIATAFAAVLLASAPMAMAQTSVAANHLMPGQIRVTKLDGSKVYDTYNQSIGDVKDVIIDRDGKVAAVVLDVGSFLGMGGKFVAIPMQDIKVTWNNNGTQTSSPANPNDTPRFTVNLTKDQLKAAQAYDLNNNNTNTGSSTPPATPRNQ